MSSQTMKEKRKKTIEEKKERKKMKMRQIGRKTEQNDFVSNEKTRREKERIKQIISVTIYETSKIKIESDAIKSKWMNLIPNRT